MKRAFGELELAILTIIKDRNKVTVKEVHEALGPHNKYTTIMTVMNRLVEKKQLARQRHGLQYEYWLTSDQKSPSTTLERLKQRIFGGRSFSMISYLIESGNDLTPQELAEMEKIIEEAKKTRRNPS